MIKKPTTLRNVPPLVREIWETNSYVCCVVLSARIVGALLPVLLLAIGGRLIDSINQAQRSHHVSTAVWKLLAVEALVSLSMNIVAALISHFDLILTDEFFLRMNIKLISHCNQLDLATFENAAFQDRLQRAKLQVSTQVALLRNILQALQQLISVMGISLGALVVAPGLISLQLIGVLPIVIAESRFARIRYRVTKNRTPVRRWLDYLLHIISSVTAAKEIKLFCSGDYVLDEYQVVAAKHNHEDAAISAKSMRASIGLASIGTSIYYATYIILIVRSVIGLFTIGRLFFVAALLQRFRSQLAALFGSISQGADQLLYIGDIIEFFSEIPTVTSGENAMSVPEHIVSGIEFRNVSFFYEGSESAALRNVSFRIRPGETVALVGENGAGKSTLVKLITRLYDPSEGQVLLDGVDIKEFALGELRGLMTAVFQDYARYDLSALLNIAMGDVDRRLDTEWVMAAAGRAGVMDFISRLPLGLNQVLGRRFASGVDLSGGQWQRVALARAFMRKASVVILDEPTASIDARAESMLYEDAMKFVNGRITLLISHRLSNVRAADRIIVLKRGSICEEGTHTELIALGGEYADLFSLQAAGYI